MSESEFTNGTLSFKVTSKELTVGATAVIFLFSVFSLLAVIGSFLTTLEFHTKIKFSKYEKWKQFFNCFCFFTNGERILNTDNSEGQIPCLHGIRVLNMNWIILTHSFVIMIPILSNSADVIKNSSRLSLFYKSDFSVDTFFVLSGFLVGFSFFQKALLKTDKKTSWLYFYIHRYIRLTPTYMMVLAFFATIFPFLGSGPFWPEYKVDPYCKDNWLWNMLYINNFKPFHEQCMRWTWYLANDMQFYAISPLFIVTLWRWPRVGYALSGLFLCVTFALNFIITYENFIFGVGPNPDILHIWDIPSRFPGFVDLINTKPYTRIGPYLIGFLLAYIVCKRKSNKSPSLNWQTLSIGWIIASGALMICTFGFYHKDCSKIGLAFYIALSRNIYALGIGWVIFVCSIGQGGVVNKILSWKVFIPLSRLTYCNYLIHTIIMQMYFKSRKAVIIYDIFNYVILYLGFLVMSYTVGLVLSLLVEIPVMRLEAFFRKKSEPLKVLDVRYKQQIEKNH